MGDPFSVAGTAVGITSLGIQVCQIVSQYYTQYRSIHDDINNIVQRADALQGYLKSLERVKDKIETEDTALSSELQQAVQACEDVLTRLRVKVKQCWETKTPDSLSDRLRIVRKRLLWPFKRDTLMDLQAALDRFQSNLGLALHLLGLDYQADQLKALLDRTQTLHDEVSNISSAQVAHTAQLTADISNLSTQLTLTDFTTSGGLRELYAAQQAHTEIAHAGFEGLSNQSEELLKQFASIQQILQQLVYGSGSSRPSVTPFPGILVEGERAAMNVNSRFRESLRQYKHDISQQPRRSTTEGTSCLCGGASTKKASTNVGRWITFYSEGAYKHRSSCPQFSQADFSKNVGARFIMCNRLIRKFVHAGFQQSRTKGWTTIAPVLRYRAVVPRNSGVFKAIEDASEILRRSISEREEEELLPNLMNTMRQCFGKTASPTDVDEFGTNILGSIMPLFTQLIFKAPRINLRVIYDFLDACSTTGILFNEPDNTGRTAITVWQFSASQTPVEVSRELLIHLTRRLNSWTVATPDQLVEWGAKFVYDTVTEILAIEEINTSFEEKDPLLGAILRRSESEFRSCIGFSDSKYLASVLTNSEYAAPLVSWSTGLEILISSGSIDDVSEVWAALWKQALRLLHPDSLQMMLRIKIQVTLDDWYRFSYGVNQALFDRHQGHYRSVFKSLATKLLSQSVFNQCEKLGSRRVSPKIISVSLYRTPFLLLTTAEDLWEAGCRDVDVFGDYSLKSNSKGALQTAQGTPLWILAAGSITGVSWERQWPVMQWLIDKGADVWWIHHKLRTTPAHLIVRWALLSTIQYSALDSLHAIGDFISGSQTDKCSCHCSLFGCHALGSAVSKYAAKNPGGWGLWDNWNRRHYCLPFLFSILDRDGCPKEAVSAVLRVLTFEKLKLTHTCCYQIEMELRRPGDFTRPTDDEVKDIYDIEKNDLELLETLMREFEEKWHAYTGKFSSFIEDIWRPRMRELRKKQKNPDAIYRETGAKLSVLKVESLRPFFTSNESLGVGGLTDLGDFISPFDGEDSDDDDDDYEQWARIDRVFSERSSTREPTERIKKRVYSSVGALGKT